MRPESATTTITHASTVAAGVFAPGHLGELTQYLPFELVDDVLEQTRTVQRRLRELPSRVGVYFVLALGMFPRLGYARVWDKLTAGLARPGGARNEQVVGSIPTGGSVCRRSSDLGERPRRLSWLNASPRLVPAQSSQGSDCWGDSFGTRFR